MEQLIKWLKKYPVFKISKIEEMAGIPQSALAKALTGTRPLQKKYFKKLEKVLKQFGYKSRS